MPQREITERRPTNYSEWHRYPNLPKDCFLVDGDWFEMRKRDDRLVPVACFEILEVGGLFIHNAQREYPLWDAKIALYTYLKQKPAPLHGAGVLARYFNIFPAPNYSRGESERVIESGRWKSEIIMRANGD